MRIRPFIAIILASIFRPRPESPRVNDKKIGVFPIGFTIGNSAPTTRRVLFARSVRAPGILTTIHAGPRYEIRGKLVAAVATERYGRCNLRFPKYRPMSAPRITVAMIAAPCAPSACHGVDTGHAMRQAALIARPAPAPYREPPTVGRVASELRNVQLKNRTRIPPASVLPIPQAKPMIHGETRSNSLIRGGTRRRGSFKGLVANVRSVRHTTTNDAAIAAR